MSKSTTIQIVSESFSYSLYHQSLLKPSYTFNLSSSIQRTLDPHSHSVERIDTHDVFIFIQEKERIRKLIVYNDAAYRLFIQMIGQHFEKSPSEFKTELPLMILSQTESIFLRRRKRLKKIQKEEYSSNGSSTSQISFSKSYMGRSSCNYIQSRLSQKDISQISQFKSSLIEDYTIHQVYEPQFSSNESQLLLLKKRAEENFNEWLLLSGIKRQNTKQDQRDQVLINAIKSPQEEQLDHLIMGDISRTSQTLNKNQQVKGASFDLESVYPEYKINPPQYENWNSQLPLEIKRRVERELHKYRLFSSLQKNQSQSSSVSCPLRKKVRQKAQELLLSIENLR